MKLIIQVLGLILISLSCQAQGRANWKINELREDMSSDYTTITLINPDSTMLLSVDCGNYYIDYIFDKDSICQYCYTFFKNQSGLCEYMDQLEEVKVYDSARGVWLSKDIGVLYTTIPIYRDGDIMYFITTW